MTRGATIAAVASPPGGAPRCVVRTSGPRAAALVAATCTRGGEPLVLRDRGVYEGHFHDGVGSLPVRVLFFPGPHSFTREDVAELHLPGAAALVRRALARLLGLGAVAAQPGEFTRRAFANGRIDLSRAEGVLALVEARTRAERRAATVLLLGGLSDRMAALRDVLDEARALVEASLDFDEADTGHVPVDEVRARLDAAALRLAEARGFEARRVAERGEPRVVLVGAPNAGKSSLFNALVAHTAGAQRVGRAQAPEERALVADHRGTTRDTKAVALEYDGLRFVLVDTAGLEGDSAGRPPDVALGTSVSRGAPDLQQRAELERRAEELTTRARAGADVLVWVVDASPPGAGSEAAAEHALDAARVPVLAAWSRIDRAGAAPTPRVEAAPGLARARAVVPTSARDGRGVAALLDALVAQLRGAGRGGAGGGGGEDGPTAAALAVRTAESLAAAESELHMARTALADGAPLDLVAQLLRDATDHLDAVTGRTTPEDLLDRIFARFCLGK